MRDFYAKRRPNEEYLVNTRERVPVTTLFR